MDANASSASGPTASTNGDGSDAPTTAVPAVEQAVPVASAAPPPPISTKLGDNDAPNASEAPYCMAQPTPNGVVTAPSTLPPIAMGRPLGGIGQIQTHLAGGSNIPVNPNAPNNANGSYNNAHGADPTQPYVTVMAMAPSAVTGDADVDNMRFQFLQKSRWVAAMMLAYYFATFFFLQPFFLGVMGILTGVLGYYGSRAPMDLQRVKWVRWYVWCNYGMLLVNIWVLVVALFFSGTMYRYDEGSSDSDGDSGSGSDNDGMMTTSSYYYSSNLGLFVGLLVAANMIVHLQGLRVGQRLLVELLAAGIMGERQGPVIVLNNQSAV